MSNPLESIVDETKLAFLHAKSDGKLDAGEVVQIAVGVAQKLQRLGSTLSGSEKKALVLLTLRRGLAAAGGVESLPGMAEASAETRAAVEGQLFAAAGAALDVAVAVAAGKIDLRKPAAWRALCLPFCSVAAAMVPKDMPLVKEALEMLGVGAPAAGPAAAAPPAEQTPAPSQPAEVAVSVPQDPAPAPEQPAPPATESGTAPNPEASAEAPPAPSGEVKFE